MTDEETTRSLPALDTTPSLTPHADTAHTLATASIAPNTRGLGGGDAAGVALEVAVHAGAVCPDR